MARVTFKAGQPIQSLSGTIGNLTYRTINGKTFVRVRGEVELASNASTEAKAAYRRKMIVDECVRIIQEEISDMAAAIQARAGIRAAMKRYYDQFSTETGSRLKLQAKMLEAYRNRRQKQDLGSTRVGNESNKK